MRVFLWLCAAFVLIVGAPFIGPSQAQDCITLETAKANVEERGGTWLGEGTPDFTTGSKFVYYTNGDFVFAGVLIQGCLWKGGAMPVGKYEAPEVSPPKPDPDALKMRSDRGKLPRVGA